MKAARVTVHYAGRVHGVGFRATVRQLACGYEVAGTVRNLSDGRVELVAEGARAEIEAFLEGIATSDLSSFIAGAQPAWDEPRGDLRGFRVVP
jgi:acylphosphatase